jgi:hypothetical protein
VQAASAVPEGALQKAAIGAVETMEATMRVLAIKLMRLTRIELIDLLVRITNMLRDMPEGSANWQIVHMNLRNIRTGTGAARSDGFPQGLAYCRVMST